MVAVTEHVLVPEFHVPILVQSPPFPSVMVNVPEAEVGGVVSAGASGARTVTVKLAVPVFPAASDAVQVTVVVPSEKLEPEDGEQVGPEVTATLSDAVTLNVVVSPPEPSTSVTVTLLGTLTTGGVASA